MKNTMISHIILFTLLALSTGTNNMDDDDSHSSSFTSSYYNPHHSPMPSPSPCFTPIPTPSASPSPSVISPSPTPYVSPSPSVIPSISPSPTPTPSPRISAECPTTKVGFVRPKFKDEEYIYFYMFVEWCLSPQGEYDNDIFDVKIQTYDITYTYGNINSSALLFRFAIHHVYPTWNARVLLVSRNTGEVFISPRFIIHIPPQPTIQSHKK